MSRRLSAAVLLAVLCLPAYGHLGHGSALTSFEAGFIHPLLGMDHLLFMLAVGMWARRDGGKTTWKVPLIFLIWMLGGFALGLQGLNIPAVEFGIASSVVLLGILVGTGARGPSLLAVWLAAPLAAMHGHAHATELAGDAATFVLGFVLSTCLLQLAGMFVPGLVSETRRAALRQGLGGILAAAGLVLLGGLA